MAIKSADQQFLPTPEASVESESIRLIGAVTDSQAV
jgi:hypothetical protein